MKKIFYFVAKYGVRPISYQRGQEIRTKKNAYKNHIEEYELQKKIEEERIKKSKDERKKRHEINEENKNNKLKNMEPEKDKTVLCQNQSVKSSDDSL